VSSFGSVEELTASLDATGYLVEEGLATALFLAQSLGQPLLLEGEPGVGKTAAAKAMAEALGTRLLRLQCYEGIAANEALYEWNYPRQLLAIRLSEADGQQLSDADLFSAEYLVERPLLAAVRHQGPTPPVVLIDEIDRADDEFEALLFEFLGEQSITIPELGTIAAATPPIVILTSNRSRELHDALKRRCGGVCTTGSTPPRRLALPQSCVAMCPMPTTHLSMRRPRSWAAPDRSTWTSRLGWPRPSIGSVRSRCSASAWLTRTTPTASLARSVR